MIIDWKNINKGRSFFFCSSINENFVLKTRNKAVAFAPKASNIL